MGTKNQPGKFDCYNAAEPDEPMFVLLGRDRHAPTLVWLWACLRAIDGEKEEVVVEAQNCCAAMMVWAQEHKRPIAGIGTAVLSGVLELIRQANYSIKTAPNTPTGEDFLRMLLAKTVIEKEEEGQ